jgi:hypothetical protein
MYASDYCHCDCHFPYSVKDIVDGNDLTFAQKEKLLGKNAVEFFRLRNLPKPAALAHARHLWNEKPSQAAVA